MRLPFQAFPLPCVVVSWCVPRGHAALRPSTESASRTGRGDVLPASRAGAGIVVGAVLDAAAGLFGLVGGAVPSALHVGLT